MEGTTLKTFTILAAAALTATACRAVAQPAFQSAAQAAPRETADLILSDGQIYTADGGWAKAMAIRHGVVLAVGDQSDVDALKGPATRVMDLHDRTVLPGFHDMHLHPMGAGQMLTSCVLKREATPDEIRTTVKACAARKKKGEWITGGSWVNDVFKSAPQDRALLDEAAPDNPVILMDETGHSSWANSLALKIAGVDRNTKDPLNGAIEHRPDGEPNGLLRETAANLVRSKVPRTTPEENAANIKAALDEMLKNGITSAQDAWANDDSLTGMDTLADRGDLKIRIKACIGWAYNITGVDQNFEAVYARRSLYRRDRVSPNCVKVANDGVPGESHTAAMLEPYATDVPGDTAGVRRYGIMTTPPEVLKKIVTRFDRDGMSMLIHCTGDACARAAVDAIEAARNANGYSGVLHQVGHNDFTTAYDLKRGRALGATFEYSAYLYYWNGVTRTYLKALGPERFKRFKPLRETIDDGALALEGSDWPVSPSTNPWVAIETLITREQPGGGGEALALPEAITMKEAIDIYTVNAAKQFGHADSIGSIKPGMIADLVVIDRNPFTVPITTVHDTKVEATIIDGEVVYQAPGN
jgi:predicted amidohydrolase YtcJ